jgi:hypothetical protein
MVLVSFDDLLTAAKRGDWEFVDGSLERAHLTPERIRWAIQKGIVDPDPDVRDFAATVLEDSDPGQAFTEKEQEVLLQRMDEDDYDIVRYRIAIALYKRGNRDSGVVGTMHEAALNRYIYKEARALLDAKT